MHTLSDGMQRKQLEKLLKNPLVNVPRESIPLPLLPKVSGRELTFMDINPIGTGFLAHFRSLCT